MSAIAADVLLALAGACALVGVIVLSGVWENDGATRRAMGPTLARVTLMLDTLRALHELHRLSDKAEARIREARIHR